ncbi:YdeI/OmpD-associated family protein [Ulvibacterium sp.]|uniref:YdeI/OmpD-associated family protein n=1 Tax=Ulvibacterium sp. TaxID=2665914 RepID=UPI003BAA8E98
MWNTSIITMDTSDKVETYFKEEHLFKKEIAILRNLAHKTEAVETFKWHAPVYTINNKNVFWIARFKHHFGLGFFNGMLLKDSKKVLENAQEGKTQAMRHWKFTTIDEIDQEGVLSYMIEALENQKKGTETKPLKKKKAKAPIPHMLKEALNDDEELEKRFKALSPYKQNEYTSYIADAKQEKTKLSRLQKIIPLLREGKGLNDSYR